MLLIIKMFRLNFRLVKHYQWKIQIETFSSFVDSDGLVDSIPIHQNNLKFYYRLFSNKLIEHPPLLSIIYLHVPSPSATTNTLAHNLNIRFLIIHNKNK